MNMRIEAERFTFKNFNYQEETMKRLQELEDKLESGQLVELICRVGDTCWFVNNDGKIHKGVVLGITTARRAINLPALLYKIGFSIYLDGRKQAAEFVGWHIYTTKAEAKARLKKMQEK